MHFSLNVCRHIITAKIRRDDEINREEKEEVQTELQYLDDLLTKNEAWFQSTKILLPEMPTKDDVLSLFISQGIITTSDLRMSIGGS